MAACKYVDKLCPCQDGDQCHYEGQNPMRPEFILSALGDMVFDGDEWYEELLADLRTRNVRAHPCATGATNMGIEVRRVPADWQHPIDPETGHHMPLFDGKNFARRVRRWDEHLAKWAEGLRDDYNGGWQPIGDVESKTFAEWNGNRPAADDYMPRWTDAERTHLMMYESTTKGTPISPSFETPEELARWLVDNEASSFGNDTASYEGWLRVAQEGYACGAIYSPATGLVSDVDAF